MRVIYNIFSLLKDNELKDRIILHIKKYGFKSFFKKSMGEILRKPGDNGSKLSIATYRNNIEVKLRVFLETQKKLEFSYYERPVVSIILVLFNKAELTFECLESIKAHADVPYEIVIVDNNSSDFTLNLLDRLDNVKVIKNNENVGFLKACNQGVGASRGKHVLFLNNDTQIFPDTLKSLVDALEEGERVGAVGGRLIYPNGKLQEAGCIIWNDGTTTAYGRNEDPFKPEYSFLRKVYYCSAALMLTPKDLFIELGMFDETFNPAYYEDTDYCMKIHKRGYKVIYQPRSIILHHEYGSANKRWADELMEENRKKFVTKWGNVLSLFYDPKPENILKGKEYEQDKMRISSAEKETEGK